MDAYKKVIGVSTIMAALLIIILIIYFFFFNQSSSSQDSTSPGDAGENVSIPSASPMEKQNEDLIVEKDRESTDPLIRDITLNASDEPIRRIVSDFSTHPEIARWLKSKNIVRRCVAIVDNISNGNSPGPHLEFLMPSGRFKVIEGNGKIILDPASYIRYQPIAMALVSIDSERFVRVYRQLLPVIEEAYSELGYPGINIQETLEQAVDVLLKTPILKGDILLEEKVTTYAFAEPELEALNDAQKHLLRMGPQNIKKIQDKLREIKKILQSASSGEE